VTSARNIGELTINGEHQFAGELFKRNAAVQKGYFNVSTCT
jgi:hypothetical protein